MPATPRSPESCPHRLPLTGSARHACGLLLDLAGPITLELATVEPPACLTCCREFPPSTRDLNPVVASLLFSLASQLARTGGDPQTVARLLDLADRNIPDESESSPLRTSAIDPIEAILPTPSTRTGPPIRSWSVGVTTSLRPVPTLTACLHSLSAAGWHTPRLFIDGPAPIDPEFDHLPRTLREPVVGAWPSYYLALAELAMREPEADAYLIVQDDAFFLENAALRTYLETILWPDGGPGVASLFCSKAYDRPGRGWRRFSGHWVWCALAFIFSRDAAQLFLADPGVVSHRSNRSRDPQTGIDWRIGAWALATDTPIYYPCPSLVQHIGHTSTLWPGERIFNFRRASRFAGDEPVD